MNDSEGEEAELAQLAKPSRNRGDSSGEKTRGNKQVDLVFVITATLIQAFILIMYAVATDYHDGSVDVSPEDEEGGTILDFYGPYQDVHVMMFIGFGFLMTFLRKYGFGSISFNFLICGFGLQWGMFMFHMIPWWFGDKDDKLELTTFKLIDGDIATAVVLISFGAVLGRTNPSQLLVMGFIELVFWALNFHICASYLKIIDVGGSIVVHSFGAYFGMAVAWVLGKPKNSEDNKSMYHSDLFSMIGTLFLWLYWPSFNGFFASKQYYFMDRAFINTVLALSGSTMASFIVSRLLKNGKFDMVHIQNATLAGGVAVGAAADLYLHPSGAISVGLFAGTISVVGYVAISDWLEEHLAIPDTCGVHNLHGMPGVLGGIISAIAIGAADGGNVYASCDSDGWIFGYCDLQKQAGYQIIAILVTLGIAITSGLLTGFIVKTFRAPLHEFKDEDNFIVPLTSKDYLRGTIRKQFFGNKKRAIDDEEESDD